MGETFPRQALAQLQALEALKITLFIPCFVDLCDPRVGISMVAILERLGHTVDYGEELTCCGQPAFNSGYWDEARPIAKRVLNRLKSSDVVLIASGSCGAMIKRFYPELFAGTAQARLAEELSARCYEFSDFLVTRLGVTDLGARFPHRVTLHDGCHGLRELGTKKQPRQLLGGEISDLFERELGSKPTDSPEELMIIARRVLRGKYLTADVGISGANFAIAETGMISITENEGNARLTCAFPSTHIALMGIEKVLPKMEDLALFLPMLATAGAGQTLTGYNSLYGGPRQPGEPDGPEEFHLVLLDNKRTHLLADAEQRDALHCIRCGACLNVCPIYRNVGGHCYGTTYQGPIAPSSLRTCAVFRIGSTSPTPLPSAERARRPAR